MEGWTSPLEEEGGQVAPWWGVALSPMDVCPSRCPVPRVVCPWLWLGVAEDGGDSGGELWLRWAGCGGELWLHWAGCGGELWLRWAGCGGALWLHWVGCGELWLRWAGDGSGSKVWLCWAGCCRGRCLRGRLRT